MPAENRRSLYGRVQQPLQRARHPQQHLPRQRHPLPAPNVQPPAMKTTVTLRSKPAWWFLGCVTGWRLAVIKESEIWLQTNPSSTRPRPDISRPAKIKTLGIQRDAIEYQRLPSPEHSTSVNFPNQCDAPLRRLHGCAHPDQPPGKGRAPPLQECTKQKLIRVCYLNLLRL